jgi:hypothetical protein
MYETRETIVINGQSQKVKEHVFAHMHNMTHTHAYIYICIHTYVCMYDKELYKSVKRRGKERGC